ncbi:MAG: hypothetical protein LBU65_16560, partial [Planctomycetaceae bacterium]|nr:hypothetical protein [Planctomycetaceae bacterium]
MHQGRINLQEYQMTYSALIKHLAMAGFHYAPNIKKLMRIIGMLFHYSLYLRCDAINDGHFSIPPEILSDPTEKGQFSTLAGKAIADFLSKRIDNSHYTVNYETDETTHPKLEKYVKDFIGRFK